MLKSEQEFVETQLHNWINQFKKFDRPSVRNMINDLIMVSYSTFENNISKIILNISKQYNKIALFPVEELSQENMKLTDNNNPNKMYLRRTRGSSSQIDYFLQRLGEQHPRKLIARPKDNSMISEKIGAIIYVDDFIGSGNRIITFWKNFISKKIKSWLSYRKCDIYFVSYAYMNAGINNILKSCRGISINEFMAFHKNPTFMHKNEIIRLCDRYMPLDKNRYGYGDTLTNIVFEWKCPNNTPPILWIETKNWKPLLPARNIDKNLFSYLSVNHDIRIIETLWNKGQYKIAITLAENINALPEDTINFICFLSLIAKRLSISNIQQILEIDDIEMNRIIAKAENLHAITYGRISEYGKELLEYYRTLSRQEKNSLQSEFEDVLYVPSQYGGYSCI